ncbi:retinol dehydrogenase 8 [Myiozetetes cayanensis]|uniref:retinol dehydrogenase 8 n=1 Tax=Myiozetetes cayanensis TaxID=478635 RepID=UPI00215E494F|nr:retinol dehydrogenase 8 [Myiozetetes cayanensis]
MPPVTFPPPTLIPFHGEGAQPWRPPARTVLVTGCSSGIGLAVAARLARDPQKRYQVVATMRDLSRRGPLEEAAGETLGVTLRILRLDVTSDSSVAECLGVLGALDVLVNNAGVGEQRRVGLVGPLEAATPPQVQRVFDTNVFGVLRLIRALLPQMKQRRSGHIVVVSSVMGLHGVAFNDIYSASKFAVEGLCESLAVQLLQFNIFVSLVEPGPVHTEFERKVLDEVATSEFPGADPETLRHFRDIYLPVSRDVFHTFGQTPDTVAEAIVSVIGAPRPPLRTPTNPLYSPLIALRFADPRGDLGVRTLHRMIYDLRPAFHLSLALLRCLTCRCCQRRVTPY